MIISSRRRHALLTLLKRIEPVLGLFADIDFGPSVPGSVRGPALRIIADARRLLAPLAAIPEVPARRPASIDLVIPLLQASQAIDAIQRRNLKRRQRDMETYPRRLEDE